ncbi:MAG: FAD-dependent oxidoreductase [Bacteroidetes bacterium]|nr:FAD-dependent oxidoreductase [Bacteroidota bacterium]
MRLFTFFCLNIVFITFGYGQPTADQYSDSTTVLIVGGGIAGLSAAKHLQESGIPFIVLEAQHRVGGRIKTDTTLGFPFDEGASWIHGSWNNPITSLAEESGAITYTTDDDNILVYDVDGSIYQDELLDSQEKEFKRVLNIVKRSGTFNSSFESVFNSNFKDYSEDRLWKFMLSSYLEFDTGGDISRLSSKFFFDDKNYVGKDVMITNGYDLLTNAISDSLDIRLYQRVNTIDYSRDYIIVSSQNKFYKSKYILVTVPLGVLKRKVITFKPPLPQDKSNGIDHLEMGVINKFVLVWDTVFWDTEPDYIGLTPETKGKFNTFLNLKKTNNVNALMTFTFGNYSKVAEELSDEEVKQEIMSHLKIMYGADIPNPISFRRTKWNGNINSYGSYSFATSGIKTNVFETLSREVENKLFFAGEHTSWNYRGTVHGAYSSGIREAKKIISLIE